MKTSIGLPSVFAWNISGFVLLFALSGCQKSPEEAKQTAMPPMEVKVQVMQSTSVPISAEAVAQTEGAKEVEIRPRVGGIVLKKHFQEGQAIQAGQTMFTLDPEPFRIALAQANAQLAQQKARVEQMQRETTRLQGLLATQSISQREYDNMSSDLAVAKASVLQAEAAVSEASLNLSYTTVKSPTSGVAGRFLLSEGALVTANTSLLSTIVQVSPIWVRFSLSETELTPLGGYLDEKRIKDIRLILHNGQEYAHSGRLNFAASTIDPALGTQQLRAEFENADHQLLPGQFVRARVVTGERDGVFLLPQTAVLTGEQGRFVFVAEKDKTGKVVAAVRPVQEGGWMDTRWIILSGLNEGDQVLIDNLIKVRPGAEIKPVPLSGEGVSSLTSGHPSVPKTKAVDRIQPTHPAKREGLRLSPAIGNRHQAQLVQNESRVV